MTGLSVACCCVRCQSCGTQPLVDAYTISFTCADPCLLGVNVYIGWRDLEEFHRAVSLLIEGCINKTIGKPSLYTKALLVLTYICEYIF